MRKVFHRAGFLVERADLLSVGSATKNHKIRGRKLRCTATTKDPLCCYHLTTSYIEVSRDIGERRKALRSLALCLAAGRKYLRIVLQFSSMENRIWIRYEKNVRIIQFIFTTFSKVSFFALYKLNVQGWKCTMNNRII